MIMPCAAVSVAVNGGDVNLRASMTDVTFADGPSFKGVTFSIDYYVNKKDVAFEFTDTVRVLGKPLNLMYTHWRGENLTELDGTLVLGPANKLSANYGVGSRNCRLKFSYLHGGSTSFEPCYDFAKNSWELAVSRRVHEDDVRASYQSSSKNLGLEWPRSSKQNGGFRILASLNLADKSKVPKLSFHQILPDL